jgi:hypothetical protein
MAITTSNSTSVKPRAARRRRAHWASDGLSSVVASKGVESKDVGSKGVRTPDCRMNMNERIWIAPRKFDRLIGFWALDFARRRQRRSDRDERNNGCERNAASRTKHAGRAVKLHASCGAQNAAQRKA